MKAVACLRPVLTTRARITAQAMTIMVMVAGMMITDTVVTGTTTMVMAVVMITMDTVVGMTITATAVGMMTTGTAAVTGITDIPLRRC